MSHTDKLSLPTTAWRRAHIKRSSCHLCNLHMAEVVRSRKPESCAEPTDTCSLNLCFCSLDLATSLLHSPALSPQTPAVSTSASAHFI
eukprot:295828-Pelagomonas_calceolata.AAC.2